MSDIFARNEFLAGIFDTAAPRYSCVGPEYFKYFGNKLIEGLMIFPNAAFLDIACGRGASLFPAYQKAGKFGNVIGIDFSLNMVNETKKTIAENGYSNINVLQMNAEELFFEDNSFDFISCGFAIQFFANHHLALKEALRVLKPGGKIGIAVWKKREKPPIVARTVAKYTNLNEVKKDPVPKTEFGIPETLEAILSGAGFINIRIIEECKRFYYRDEEQWWQDQWTLSFREHLEKIERMGPGIMASFKKDVLNELEEIRDAKGIYFSANVLLSFAEK